MAVIFNKTSNTLVSGTDSADSIKNGGYDSVDGWSYLEDVTIESGAGNDTIDSTDDYFTFFDEEPDGRLIQYADGDGNDIVNAFNRNDTIQLLNNSTVSSISKNGNDIIVSIGSGSINLKNTSDIKTPIYFIDQNKNESAFVFDGNDSVKVDIYDSTASIEGADGNDAIKIRADYYNDDTTIDTGLGNDTIYHLDYSSRSNFIYDEGDGEDVIYG